MKPAVFNRHMHLTFTARQAERIQVQAARDERSMSELIRTAVREHLDAKEQVAA